MIYARDTKMNKTDFPHLGSAWSYMTLKVLLHLAWSPHTGQALCWACSMDIMSHSSRQDGHVHGLDAAVGALGR